MFVLSSSVVLLENTCPNERNWYTEPKIYRLNSLHSC